MRQIEFSEAWKYAHGGYRVESFAKGQKATVSNECALAALKDGVARIIAGGPLAEGPDGAPVEPKAAAGNEAAPAGSGDAGPHGGGEQPSSSRPARPSAKASSKKRAAPKKKAAAKSSQ